MGLKIIGVLLKKVLKLLNKVKIQKTNKKRSSFKGAVSKGRF